LYHYYFNTASLRAWIGLSFFPFLGAGAFLAMHIAVAHLSTRAILQPGTRKIQVTGIRHAKGTEFSFDDVVAVQRLYAGVKGGGDGESWEAYQINFVFTNGTRYNLLDSEGKEHLDRIGEELAKQLRVPFTKHDKTGEQRK
jgi:hypothetical protein